MGTAKLLEVVREGVWVKVGEAKGALNFLLRHERIEGCSDPNTSRRRGQFPFVQRGRKRVFHIAAVRLKGFEPLQIYQL